MRYRHIFTGWTAGLAVLLVFSGCGGEATPTGPSDTVDLAVVGSACGSAIYFISGLSSRVVDPSAAAPFEARVRVGETVKLQLNYQGCGFTRDEIWLTTNGTVAAVAPETQLHFRADLKALSPGEVSVYAEFGAPDGGRHRTTTAYCELDAQYPGLPGLGVCSNPRKIGVVRVVP